MILSGVFGQLRNLDKIPIDNIRQWLKNKGEIHQLQNFIGNRVIYPQTIATTLEDQEVDLGLLREGIKSQPQVVFNRLTNKIGLSTELINRFPPPDKLVVAIVQVLNLSGITRVYLKDFHQLIGTVVSVRLNLLAKSVVVTVDGQVKKIPSLGITYLPIDKQQVRLKIGDREEQMVAGGKLGILLNFIR